MVLCSLNTEEPLLRISTHQVINVKPIQRCQYRMWGRELQADEFWHHSSGLWHCHQSYLQLARYGRVLLLHPPPGVCQTKAQELQPVGRKLALSKSESDLFKAPATLWLCDLHMQIHTHFLSADHINEWSIWTLGFRIGGDISLPLLLTTHAGRKLWGFNRLTSSWALQVSSNLAISHTFTLQKE